MPSPWTASSAHPGPARTCPPPRPAPGIGSAVTGCSAGDRVLGGRARDGPGLTALAAADALNLRQGSTVLVIGATGGVGAFAVQLAAKAGATVIASGLPKTTTTCAASAPPRSWTATATSPPRPASATPTGSTPCSI